MELTNTASQSRKTQAFGYLRVSGKGQEDGDGFSRQRLAIEQYAVERGLEIVRWFQDTQTGKDEWEDRPGWSDMVASLNGVRTIVVEKLDRLARELFVQEYILRDLKKREVVLLSKHEHDLAGDEDPTRVLFRQLVGAIAHYDRSMIVLKLRSARAKIRARDGKCEGRKAYGFWEPERAVIEQMRGMRKEQRMTFEQIAVGLNGMGVLSRTGGKWIGAAVCKILRREGI